MHDFAELLQNLYFTYSNNEKMVLLQHYFRSTPDPDRGYALAIMSGSLNLKFFKASMVHELIEEQIDPVLYALSYDYVGDLSETVALLWPGQNKTSAQLPSLTEIIETFTTLDKASTKDYLRHLMNQCNANERWALIKFGAGELRVGISGRFLKQALARFGDKNIHEIEEVWHALSPPYQALFHWLEGKTSKPELSDQVYFHPVMLSQPLNEKELQRLPVNDFMVEWKYDGIRVQLVSTAKGKALYSRSGDDISHTFPDIMQKINFHATLDGELVIKQDETIGSFNSLQQRLNRKKPSQKLMREFPAHIILYDVLSLDDQDMRHLALLERRQRLEAWYKKKAYEFLSLSPLLSFNSLDELQALRNEVIKKPHVAIEGLMLKRITSSYVAGRPSGQWYKWKRDPYLIDAVLMYAQRGSGKRSSFYSDFTFGLWHGEQLLPVGKAYFGFTDEELKEIDKWVRHHTIQKFGPVCDLEKKLVLEIAFEAVQKSSRHKSGYALRFPRINRIRWDKPANEADHISALHDLFNIKRDNRL